MPKIVLALFALLAALCGSALAADEPKSLRPAGTTESEISVEFSFRPNKREIAGVREVTVAGDFNRWNAFATPLARGTDGVFRARLRLRPGAHQWRYVLNGAWVQDMQAVAGQCSPRPESFVDHPSGGRNARADLR